MKTVSIKIYPNPASEFIYIETGHVVNHASIRFYDLQGRIVAEKLNANGQTFSFGIARHKPGVYIIEA